MLQRKIIVAVLVGLSALGVSTLASAALPGFYAGIQGGYANTHYSAGDFGNFFPANFGPTTTADTKTKGAAGRGFIGYLFDQNFALEAGFTQFSNSKFNNLDMLPINGTLKQNAIDLVGKGILPLGNDFSVYGKLGAAYVTAKASIDNSVPTLSDTEHKVYPTFGAGLSYDVTPNLPISIGWDRIQKIGGNSKLIQNADFVSLSIAYNFGNIG